MKRFLTLLLTMCAVLALPSCGSAEKKPEPTAAETEAATESAQVDLTIMSSTMIYSKVFNMVTNPKDYLGQTVIMRGNFNTVEEDGTRYFACLIPDATACCTQGIEFELSGKHSYPKDYPEVDSEITVKGEFDYYKKNLYTYCVLRDAEFL